MPVVDIYSKRQKRLPGETPDVYQYETISHELRVQVVHIMNDVLGQPSRSSTGILYSDGAAKVYAFIHKTLCREYGIFILGEEAESDFDAVVDFLLKTEEIEKAIDVIELFFQQTNQPDPNDRQSPINIFDVPRLNEIGQKNYQQILSYYAVEKHSQYKRAVNELNQRFREHGVGYQYESGQIIRVDSQYLHSEAVQPALTMLSDSMYQGANAEFLSAHEHYRAKRYKECLNDCLKALESCLKAICDKRGWVYGAKDTANRLINIVLKNELIPEFMQSHLSGLRSALEAGVPTLRNELGGHGQGTQEILVPEHIATYALHLTASNILFLAQANENLT